MSSPSPAQPVPHTQQTGQPAERVALGLLAASLAVLGGIVVTVVVARLGFIAAITSLAIAFGAAFLYQAAAGRSARKGLVPLILLIVLGVVASFFAIVASDLWDVSGELGLSGGDRTSFIADYIFDPELLKEYGKDLALFGLFAVLGVFGVIKQLFDGR